MSSWLNRDKIYKVNKFRQPPIIDNVFKSTDKVISKYHEPLNRQLETADIIRIKNNTIQFPNISPLTVYIISNIKGGGTYKYVNDIISNFNTRYINFVEIDNISDFENKMNTKNSIIFIQNLISTKIEPDLIVSKMKELNSKVILLLHDCSVLTESLKGVHNAYLNNVEFNSSNQNLLYISEVIAPSKFIINEIKKVYHVPNYKIVEHIDILSTISDTPTIPNISNNTINVCIPTNLSEYKGVNYYEHICKNIHTYTYNNITYSVNYLLFINKGDEYYEQFKNNKNIIILNVYKEDELYEILKKYNIHLLLLLNKWGETYSYCLSKCLNSGLPIVYSNIGAYIERIPKQSYFFPVEPDSSTNQIDIESIIPILFKSFYYIIANNGNTDITKEIYDFIPKYYYDLFNEHILQYINDIYLKNKENYNNIFKIVQPYAIYFPQFHEIKENNINFYKGFSDMINLKNIKKNNNNLHTPLNGLLGYYNLKYNKYIIDTEISLAKAYGFKGFGLYYYWFFTNNITNEHKIFSDIIDYFFNNELEDFDVFFMYCNEAWTNNPVFTIKNNTNRICNDYSEINISKFCNDLLPYFKHKNYRKIDNKPVFTLHQPWEMNDEQINYMFKYLDIKCIESGFDGIYFLVNAIDSREYKNDKYYCHPAYKNTKNSFMYFDNHPIINYESCVNSFINTNQNEKESLIRSCFTNFNNSVRLYHNIRYNTLYTSTINNSEELFRKFMNIQLSHYIKNSLKSQILNDTQHQNTSDISKIMLFNAWNEWGEQMTIAPSNELGFSYLHIIQDELLKILH
jgi:hypothetical protein